MRKRAVEVFFRQNGDWFYVGAFKSYPLPDMTPAEFEQLDEMVRAPNLFSLQRVKEAPRGVDIAWLIIVPQNKDSIVRRSVEKWPADQEKKAEMEKELIQLYEEGNLKVNYKLPY